MSARIDARRQAARVHPILCRCSRCNPIAAAERRRAHRFAAVLFLGLAIAAGAAAIIIGAQS